MKAVGIDIGTTTICGIVVDAENGQVYESKTLANDSGIKGADYESLQDPERIWELAKGIYLEFCRKYYDIVCVGLTGQMHGILYLNEEGKAVSPLYTWQDESGYQENEEGLSFLETLLRESGSMVAAGYGLTTVYVHEKKGKIPKTAAGICTIADYIGMRLVGRKSAILTPSMAASLGCYDLRNLCFDKEACRKANIPERILPHCEKGIVLLGKTKEGISVAAALGDNQASMTGSVKNEKESVLINVGTGSQVSVVTDHYVAAEKVELRPYIGECYLLAGASLCGGRAYAALEHFFEQTVEAMTGEKSGDLYGRMSVLMEKWEMKQKKDQKTEIKKHLLADTRFCGSRENPALTGSIKNLTIENFTPEDMTAAVLHGIAEELHTFHGEMRGIGVKKPGYLIGSGNGIRRNPWLKKIFEEMYDCRMQIPMHQEEAAFGAALYALCVAGVKKDMSEAQQLISYLE